MHIILPMNLYPYGIAYAYMLMYVHTYTAISVIIQEGQSVAKLVINPEVYKSNGQIVPVTTKSNSVKDSLGTVASREVIMYMCICMIH